MKRLYTFGGQFAERNWTVADLLDQKGRGKLTQIRAETGLEASAAQEAGIDMIAVGLHDLAQCRKHAPTTYITASLSPTEFVTEDEVLRAASAAMDDGADAVYTIASLRTIERLAESGIPVNSHLGFIPRKSTWIGGIRAYGKTADEATKLWRDMVTLENAGAYSVEIELVPQQLLAELSARTGLLTISMGSGSGGDVIFLFGEDVCGTNPNPPRHAQAYGDLTGVLQQVERDRVAAMKAFDDAVKRGEFPTKTHSVSMPDEEFSDFLARIDGE